MKLLQSAAFLTSILTLTSCCDCFDEPPFLEVKFENFSNAELKTIYIVSDGLSDTCFSCVDTLNQVAYLNSIPYSQHQILSDSISLNKLVQVNKTTSETSGFDACKCRSNYRINYEYEGNFYTNEPIVITR